MNQYVFATRRPQIAEMKLRALGALLLLLNASAALAQISFPGAVDRKAVRRSKTCDLALLSPVHVRLYGPPCSYNM